ncbi:3'-5' exonuclease [Trachipleistophora hominis]|uniref:3'-5' exonuclease n=1 Tax=Trachipleistophora hominis TaxID=72359 RepID=L7JY29_TRAHO|nr:3'-5' exonuclease [Trachipleistophora hominis]
MCEIESIILKDIGDDVRPDIKVLLHVEYLQHFVVKQPFSIYLEDDRFVNSDVSVREMNKIDLGVYKSAYRHTVHKLIAIDCEMLLTNAGVELGRVTLLDIHGNTLLDAYVRTDNTVIDYRTEYSGLSEQSFVNSVRFDEAQSMVLEQVGVDTIVLGHSLYNDLKILQIKHDKLIDTSRLFRTHGNYKISLKSLADKYGCISIQNNTHCSYEDAYACLQLLSVKVRVLYELFHSERYFGFVKTDRKVCLDKLKVSERCVRTAFVSLRELESLNVFDRVNNYYMVIYTWMNKMYAGVYDSKR